MTDIEGGFVTSIDSLSARYANPAERVLKKRLDHVNPFGRAFIAARDKRTSVPAAYCSTFAQVGDAGSLQLKHVVTAA
jgi:hypothetical protein